jgi:nicotinate-nucleotide adenylyltransferase
LKKIGLYFGSFNPIHVGHLIIADYFSQQNLFDEVWLVVSPHNPLKDPSDLASVDHRLEMARIATADHSALKVCDIETRLPSPSFTVNTMKALQEQYPEVQWSVIIGEDSLVHFDKWKDYQWLMETFSFFVFPRVLSDEERDIIKAKNFPVQMVNAPLIEVSSTSIRQKLRSGTSIKYLVTNVVENYLSQHQLYH